MMCERIDTPITRKLKSPPYDANNNMCHGLNMLGNDSNMWRSIKSLRNGKFEWVPIRKIETLETAGKDNLIKCVWEKWCTYPEKDTKKD